MVWPALFPSSDDSAVAQTGTALFISVKNFVSIARICNALVAYDALAARLLAQVQPFVFVADIQLEATTAKLHASFVPGIKGPSTRIGERPNILIRTTREDVEGDLADFHLLIGDETVG